jgi:REP element-mobilizing transposase RayT
VCTEGKECVLSTIEDNVGEGFPLPKLTNCGMILKKWIEQISEKYPTVSVEKFVIMPNHFHLLLLLSDFCEGGRGNPSPTRVSVDKVLGWLKYNTTREYNAKRNTEKGKLFQRSYHDHIIRNQKDYLEIYRYIEENPLSWTIDCFYEK